MALTLTEAAKLSNDVLLAGVIETVIQDSPVLGSLPFIEIAGNGLTYNQQNAAPTAAFMAVGEVWTESTPTFTQLTATLKILGGDADIDNYLATTRSNVQDLEAAVLELKARAVQRLFDDAFITGDVALDSDSFDGLNKLCAGGQTVANGTNGGPLTLDKLDELIDTVKGGKPHMLVMNRRARRLLNAKVRTAGTLLETDRDELGRMVQYYDGIPVGISDWVPNTYTVGTSTDTTSIFAMQFGEDGVAGITAPGGLQIERVGSLETKDATRLRVKWYASLALFNTAKLAKLQGVRDG